MKRHIVPLLPLAVLVLASLACGGKATPSPTPAPTFGPTPTPLPVQAPGWEGTTVEAYCLAVEQNFPKVPPELEEVGTPHIQETTERVLGRLGLRAVTESCEATLAISMTGQALSADYLNAGTCYSGASVTGEMLLSGEGYSPIVLPISVTHDPPLAITSAEFCKEPWGAPFLVVWPQALLEGLAQLWGPRVPIAAMTDKEWTVSTAALRLVSGGEPVEGAVPAIIEVLEADGGLNVREEAARALGRIGAEEGVIPALMRVMEDKGEYDGVRGAAIHGLMLLGPDAAEAVPALIKILDKERFSSLSSDAARALGQIGPVTPEIIPALIEALDDKYSLTREAAAEALGQIGPITPEIIPELVGALGDSEAIVREAAAQALGQIGTEALEAVPALINALGDEWLRVPKAAIAALEAVTGQDFGYDAAAWQAWWEEQQ